jgi:WD40 repeat protein
LSGFSVNGQPPALPAINLGIAKLEQASALLDSPVLGVVIAGKASSALVAVCEDGSLHTWPLGDAAGTRLPENTGRTLQGPDRSVTALAAGGTTLASASAIGNVTVWALAEGKIARTLKAPAPVRALAVSPDGKTLASAGDDGVVHLWDPATGRGLRKLEGATNWQLAVAFSPDGKTLAAGGYDGRLRIWETASAKKLVDVATQPAPPPNTLPPPVNVIWSLAFSPDQKMVAAAGSDARIDLFASADGKLIRSLPGHTGTVTALAFHPSGTVVASGSKDRTIRLWNPQDGQMLKSLEDHGAWVQSIAFLDQGLRLASAGADRTVRLWLLGEPPKKK